VTTKSKTHEYPEIPKFWPN